MAKKTKAQRDKEKQNGQTTPEQSTQQEESIAQPEASDVVNLDDSDILELDAETMLEQFVLIKIGDTLYAIQSLYVKEIVYTAETYPLAFMPRYIRGLINRHGEPLVLFDPNILFEKEKLSKNITIIIDNEESFGIKVSEIIEFVMVDISRFVYDSMFVSDFFSFSIPVHDTMINVINPLSFLNVLRKDIKNF